MHPTLEQQHVMNGGAVGAEEAPTAGVASALTSLATDRKVSNLLAGAVIGSVAVLVALRAAGFRFSFGANIGGGA